MIDINVDKVAQVILLAREMDRAEAELDAFIERLDPEEQANLVAIFWVGRGSFDAANIDEAIATARAEATTPTGDYLKGSPHLADHLEAGLDALGIDPGDIEDAIY